MAPGLFYKDKAFASVTPLLELMNWRGGRTCSLRRRRNGGTESRGDLPEATLQMSDRAGIQKQVFNVQSRAPSKTSKTALPQQITLCFEIFKRCPGLSQQEGIGTGWARVGQGWEFSQTQWAWPGREVQWPEVSGIRKVAEGHSAGWIQAGEGSAERGRPPPGLASLCP